MKRSTRIFLGVALALMIAGMATCHFGQQHVLNQLPPDVRARIEISGETDWIGMKWIGGGTGLFLLGVVAGALPLTIYLAKRLRFRWTNVRQTSVCRPTSTS